MITIAHLTDRQRAIADLLWSCECVADVEALVAALPTHYVADARSLIAVILQENMELEGGLDQYAGAAAAVIAHVR